MICIAVRAPHIVFLLFCFVYLMRPRPPISTLFPYTTLFRSALGLRHQPGLLALFLHQLRGVEVMGLERDARLGGAADRKSTRLNSSHEWISYAVFCLKKKIVHCSLGEIISADDRAATEEGR